MYKEFTMRIFSSFFLFFVLTSNALAQAIPVLIDDRKVVREAYYHNCEWKYCDDKAKKFDDNYLKKKIIKRFKKKKVHVDLVENSAYKITDGIVVRLLSKVPYRNDIVSALASNVALGALPNKINVYFEVDYEVYKAGKLVKSIPYDFKLVKNDSVLADTQKYKKKAAKKIVKKAQAILKNYSSY